MSSEYESFWKRSHQRDAGEAELERSGSEASQRRRPRGEGGR